ncbi:Leucine- glutamate- and lysine-rich 1, partial [Brachionus plicatilis]
SVDRAEQENSFRSQVKQLTRENESHKETIDSYAKQISSFQGLKAELESQITILSSQLNQSSDLKSKLVNFEQQKQQLIQENSNLREEMNQVKANSNNMVIENSELSEKIALLNEKIGQVNMKNQSEIKAKNEEMGRLKNELNQIKRRYEDQENFENEILANNKSNMSEINRLKNELKKSTDQISDLENEIKSLTLAHQCQIVQLKDSFKDRLRKNDQWPEKLEAELTKERDKHAEALEQLEAQMKKNFKMELEIHNQKYDELYVNYQKIISDNQNMSKETLGKLEADNKNLANELKNVHEEKLRNEKKLRQELDNLRAITKDLHERLEKYSGDETENSIGHLKQKAMEKDSAICDLRAKLKQSEQQLDEFRDEIRVLQDTVHYECLEREELLEKLDKARDELLVFKKNKYSSQVMPLNKSVTKSPKNQNGALIDLDFAKNINEIEAQKNNSRRNSTPSALNRTGSEKSQPESMSKPIDSGKSHRAKIINKETISLLNSNTSNEPIQLFKKINELSNITNKQKPAHQHSLRENRSLNLDGFNSDLNIEKAQKNRTKIVGLAKPKCCQNNESSAKCNIFQQVITIYNSSTTELVKHLAEKHKISKLSHENIRPSKRFCLDFEEMANEPEESPKTIKEYLVSDLKIEKINEKLISFIIAINLPFNIVNSEEFQELLDTIKSHYYKLPCRQTLRYKLLPEMV